MWNDRSAFTDFRPLVGHFITIADNTRIQVTGVGTIVFLLGNRVIRLANVLCVPELAGPLFSVRRFRKIPGCGFFATNTKCCLAFPTFVLDIDDSTDVSLPYQSLPSATVFDFDELTTPHSVPSGSAFVTTRTGKSSSPPAPSPSPLVTHITPPATQPSADDRDDSTYDDMPPLIPRPSVKFSPALITPDTTPSAPRPSKSAAPASDHDANYADMPPLMLNDADDDDDDSCAGDMPSSMPRSSGFVDPRYPNKASISSGAVDSRYPNKPSVPSKCSPVSAPVKVLPVSTKCSPVSATVKVLLHVPIPADPSLIPDDDLSELIVPPPKVTVPLVRPCDTPNSSAPATLKLTSFQLHRYLGFRHLPDYSILEQTSFSHLRVVNTGTPPLDLGAVATVPRGRRGAARRRSKHYLQDVYMDIGLSLIHI